MEQQRRSQIFLNGSRSTPVLKFASVHRHIREGTTMKAIGSFLVLALIAVCIGAPSQAASITDDMVVYLGMDEGKGLSTKDKSGNGNDGELHNAEWVDGIRGGGLQVGGDDIWVIVPDDPTLNFAEGESFTLAIWTKRTGPSFPPGDRGNVVAKYNIGGPTTPFYGIIFDMDNKLMTFTRDGASNVILRTAEVVNEGEWHHFALVRDAGSKILQLYMDGSLASEAKDTTKDLTNAEPLAMGRHYKTLYYDGIVDELKLWRRALSGAEIQQAMVGNDTAAVDPGQKLSVSWAKLKSAQ